MERANIFTCSGSRYVSLPETVPNLTNWINFTYTNNRRLCQMYAYLKKPKSMITHLNLMAWKVHEICDDTLDEILFNSNIKWLNLARNKLTLIPAKLNNSIGQLESLWLGGNPVQCDCDMQWLISWLNSTRVSGNRLVQDHQDVICTGGKLDGIPVYKLTRVQIGCYPDRVARWIIVVSSVTGGVLLLSVILILIVHRKWNAVRWIIYKNLDKLLGDVDRNEVIENTEFDAFLSYW